MVGARFIGDGGVAPGLPPCHLSNRFIGDSGAARKPRRGGCGAAPGSLQWTTFPSRRGPGAMPRRGGRFSTADSGEHAMLETNPIHNLIKDLSERTDVLRGYL